MAPEYRSLASSGLLQHIDETVNSARKFPGLCWDFDHPIPNCFESCDVPPMVRDRVAASVLFRETLTLDNGGTVTAIGRREPDSTEISWLIEFHGDLDPSDPSTARSADIALRELRNTLGV